VDSAKATTPSDTTSSDDGLLLVWRDEKRGQALTLVPSQGRLDPFDIMPIKLGSREHNLIYYCKFLNESPMHS